MVEAARTGKGNQMKRLRLRPNVTDTAIAWNLAALAENLAAAAVLAREANVAIQQNERNRAIGAICDFEKRLHEAQALFAAALTLHRRNPAATKGGVA
jgi:hypothetical protein